MDKRIYYLKIEIYHLFIVALRLIPILVNGMKYSEIDIILLKVFLFVKLFRFSLSFRVSQRTKPCIVG